jgi:hypothetical protein
LGGDGRDHALRRRRGRIQRLRRLRRRARRPRGFLAAHRRAQIPGPLGPKPATRLGGGEAVGTSLA